MEFSLAQQTANSLDSLGLNPNALKVLSTPSLNPQTPSKPLNPKPGA